MARTRDRQRRNKTEQRKCQNHIGVETPEQSESIKILSRVNTFFDKIFTEAVRKDRQVTKNTEWKWGTEQLNDFETIEIC